MGKRLRDRNEANRSWNGPWKSSMRNKSTSVGNFLASIFFPLCLAAACVADENCVSVVEVDSTGVNPASFIRRADELFSLNSKICLHSQDGEIIIVLFDQWEAAYRTSDYNVTLFTRSSECKVLDQRVNKKTGKTITNYECKYDDLEEHRYCEFFTKPNSREGVPYAVYAYNETKLERRMFIFGPNEKEEEVRLEPFERYELNFSKFLPGSSVTIFIEIDLKFHSRPDQWVLSNIKGDKWYYVSDKSRGDPRNGDLGDFQDHGFLDKSAKRYSDPDIKCDYLDESSCKCTVQEQSMISYIESQESELKKAGSVISFGSDMASELIVRTEEQLYEVDVRLSLAK